MNDKGIREFKEIEDLCISAVMSIPYEQLDMDSINKDYIFLRDKAIRQIQFVRLLNVLENKLGNIWIEMPADFGENYLCVKLLKN